MGAWIAAAAVVSAYAASQSDAAQGKVKAGEPMYTAKNMPDALLQRYQSAQANMPVTGNVGFGGQEFPSFYGPNARMTQMLYQPHGSIGAPPGYTDPYGAAAQAALPFVDAWANRQGATDTTTEQKRMPPSVGYNYDLQGR